MSELTEPATTGTILLSQPVYKTLISGSEIEPFISNKGILDCNDSKPNYTKFIGGKISNYFCSCLQRTWDTAYVLFGEDTIEKFMVGPYLKEDMKSPSNLCSSKVFLNLASLLL